MYELGASFKSVKNEHIFTPVYGILFYGLSFYYVRCRFLPVTALIIDCM